MYPCWLKSNHLPAFLCELVRSPETSSVWLSSCSSPAHSPIVISSGNKPVDSQLQKTSSCYPSKRTTSVLISVSFPSELLSLDLERSSACSFQPHSCCLIPCIKIKNYLNLVFGSALKLLCGVWMFLCAFMGILDSCSLVKLWFLIGSRCGYKPVMDRWPFQRMLCLLPRASWSTGQPHHGPKL